MAGEWSETTLGSIAAKGYGLVDGPFGSNLPASCYTEYGVPVIRGSNLTLGTSRFRAHEFVFVSRDTAKRLERSLCRPFDIVFTKKGTLGQTGLVPEHGPYDLYLLSSNQMKLTVDRRLADPLFVYYFVSSPESTRKLIRDSEATGVPKTNVTYLRDFPIKLPSLPDQRAIAHILGTLDDKIELDRRMNETLEAMAQALFKSWFVDFEPVRAKAEGREPGLPKPLADLFPDSFEDSQVGKIPKGWSATPLRCLAGYLSRGIGPAYVEADGICVLNQKCIRDRRVDFSKARRHDPSKRSSEGRTLRLLDILVNSTGVGTLGRIAQLWSLPESAIVDSHITVVRAAKDVDPWFLGVSLIGREADVEALGEGSTGQTELSRTRLAELTCLAPPADLQARFGQLVGPLLSRLAVNERASITRAALRDTLLPKLISGELGVKNAETFLRSQG